MHRPPLKEWLADWWIHPVINGRWWKIKRSLECWVSKWTAMGIHECGGTIITSNTPMTCWFRWQNKVSSKNACRCMKPSISQVLLLLCPATSYPPVTAKMLRVPSMHFYVTLYWFRKLLYLTVAMRSLLVPKCLLNPRFSNKSLTSWQTGLRDLSSPTCITKVALLLTTTMTWVNFFTLLHLMS